MSPSGLQAGADLLASEGVPVCTGFCRLLASTPVLGRGQGVDRSRVPDAAPEALTSGHGKGTGDGGTALRAAALRKVPDLGRAHSPQSLATQWARLPLATACQVTHFVQVIFK